MFARPFESSGHGPSPCLKLGLPPGFHGLVNVDTGVGGMSALVENHEVPNLGFDIHSSLELHSARLWAVATIHLAIESVTDVPVQAEAEFAENGEQVRTTLLPEGLRWRWQAVFDAPCARGVASSAVPPMTRLVGFHAASVSLARPGVEHACDRRARVPVLA